MAARAWTSEQKKAIETRYTSSGKRCNVLVNAAAGSGKTAVLAERINQSLIPSDSNPHPTDINRMLVVTFTNAAAAEMKERIADTLEKKLEEAEDDVLTENLKRQTSLLYDADIMTIDSFCIKAIRENFHLLEIDPNFTMADSSQTALMSEEAIEELFEDLYENGDEDFYLLCDLFSDGRSDERVAEIIKEVYDFTRSMPDPNGWLEEKAELYAKREHNPWVEECLAKKNALCKRAYNELKTALEYMVSYSLGDFDDIDGVTEKLPPDEENQIQFNWGGRYGIVYYEYSAAKRLKEADWDESVAIFDSLSFATWGAKANVRNKDEEITDKEINTYVKNMRDRAKELMTKAQKLVCVPSEELFERMETMVYPAARAICNVVKKYDEYFMAKKQKKNMLEFSDAELMCLKLFEENEEVAAIYREKYDEILMDEYQDANALQEAIFNRISRGNNMFTVGDIKQSIYRFRKSDPMLFKSKCDSYSTDETAENRKITLSKNFRSRLEVLDGVNSVFERIMSEAVGDIDYNEEHRLNKGNTGFEDFKSEKFLCECCVLASDTEEEDEEVSLDRAEIEAAYIARRIAEMKKSGYTVGGKPIANKDIAILMSSYKYVADIYIAALNREGVECFAESGGYFDRNEVKMILSLIKIIQNPYRDIPLLGVMRSPIGGFSDDELVKIRSFGDGMIYDAVRECAKSPDGKKCAEFIEKLDRWRDYSKYMTCDRLLWTLYEETGVYAFVGALRGGEEARANLRLLFERAKEYENSGYKGLFHFIRYLERLEDKEEDLSGANLVGEGHDVVRIMTIHKSKGLEFPVVFLAGCAKRFNIREKALPLHKIRGMGLEEIDIDKGSRIPTVAKHVITAANFAESVSEEERKLYVAMTRAKEKLIVTGVVNTKNKPLEDYEEKWDAFLNDWESVPDSEAVCSAKCFLDWIAPVARFDGENWIYASVPYSLNLPDCEEEETEIKYDDEIKISDFVYGKKDLKYVPSKVSVTELKSGGFFEFGADIAPVPEFLSGEKAKNGADKGTAIHTVMRNLTIKEAPDAEYVEAEIRRMVEEKIVTKEEADLVEAEKIAVFYSTDLGKRAAKCGNVKRETPFETEIPLSLFDGYEAYDEKILLQGVIDCWFEEDGEIVLIDYKSDRYESPEELRKKYEAQLDWYEYALEKITGKRVKEKYIYMFYGNDAILSDNKGVRL